MQKQPFIKLKNWQPKKSNKKSYGSCEV